jgi:5-methyltetrahydrofolate--homocysteine methyltransferase
MKKIQELIQERILVVDGAMGTMIQKHKLTEEQYRGERFKDYPYPVKGNNDLLSITQPQIIEDIHNQFLSAGADIIETNTFNSNSISMEDYHMSDLVEDLNRESVKIARRCTEAWSTEDKPRFVAGSIGPTNKTLSLSPDVNNPGFRSVSFEDLRRCYYQQAKVMIEEGVDLLLVETVFDTLNCKAALFAVSELKEELGSDIPVMVSGTITDASGRTLSGQTVESFWISISHADLLSVGLNCALGASQMRPYIEELSRVSDSYISCYPNAGLPNEFGEYDDTPENMASILESWGKDGFLNIVGGCCGTTPDHIREISKRISGIPLRKKN